MKGSKQLERKRERVHLPMRTTPNTHPFTYIGTRVLTGEMGASIFSSLVYVEVERRGLNPVGQETACIPHTIEDPAYTKEEDHETPTPLANAQIQIYIN